MSKRLSDEALRRFYGQTYVLHHMRRPLRRISRLLPFFDLSPAHSVADFACGSGMLAEVIHERVGRYVGVDFSEEFIAAARGRVGFPNVSFECSEIGAFCERNPESFDRAFTLDFSEHIYDDAFERAYTAIHGAMKVEGQLYVHTPNGDYFIEMLKEKGLLRQFPEHIAVRNALKNAQLLGKIGFRSVVVHHLPHYVEPMRSLHPLSRLPHIGRFFRARLLFVCTK
jgi:2-polyprenyl-6-hydroxyphenyl methylase / 3-demethylubiquinone-9 3-methyltransferase